MSRQVLIGFVILNIIVSLAVAVIVISYDEARRAKLEPTEAPTQIQIMSLTATPIPGSEHLRIDQCIATMDSLSLAVTAFAQATPVERIITATPEGETEAVDVPEGAPLPTIDPSLLPEIPTDLPPGAESTQAAEDAEDAGPTPADDGCIRHEVVSGDVLITIAQQYGVFPGDIMIINQLDENSILNIGDVLLIPSEGCAALNTPTPIPTVTRTPFALPTLASDVEEDTASDIPPTVVNAQVAISDVLDPGNVNSEAVELRNLGDAISLQSWTLTDGDETVYTFPEFRMQPGSLIRVYTRQGPNTPAALYWGRDTAAWESGTTVTLYDANGTLQAQFTVE